MKLFAVIALIYGIISGAALSAAPGDNALLDSVQLSSQHLYMSVDEGVPEPDKVYKLCLGGRDLTEVPGGILNFINLQEVNLSQNYLKRIPEDMAKLSHLQELRLNNNELRSLPVDFADLTNLKVLELSSNPDMDWDVEMSKILKLKNLEYLDISFNNLEKIPKMIASLKKLKTLDLTGNPLSRESISYLKVSLPNTRIFF